MIQFDHSMAKFHSNIYSKYTDMSSLKPADVTDDDDDDICDKIHKHFCFLSGKDYVFERRMPFFFVLGAEWMKAYSLFSPW